MWRKYPSTLAVPRQPALNSPPPVAARHDDSRRHAMNWLLSVSGAGYALLASALWMCVTRGLKTRPLIALLPVPLVVGVIVASYQLLSYTQKYRAYRYGDGDQPSVPPRRKATTTAAPRHATFLPAADGSYQRLNLTLTHAEIKKLKQSLLLNQRYVVRTWTKLLGERASILRAELYRLGITTAPSANTATTVTEAGLTAVQKW